MAPKVGCQERVRGLENAQDRRLESPRRRTGVLLPIYQTVSLRASVNKGYRKGCRALYPVSFLARSCGSADGGYSIHFPVEERFAPARRPSFGPARRLAPLRAVVRHLATLYQSAGSGRASRLAPGSPGRLSPMLPQRSHPPLKRQEPSMLAL